MLYETAVKCGAKIRCNAKAVSADLNEDRPFVILDCGEKIEADVIVGADGMGSISRSLMIEHDDAQSTEMTMYK